MKTSLSISVLSFGVVFLCGLNSSTRAADQVQTLSRSNVTLATHQTLNHGDHTNHFDSSTTVKSAENEPAMSVKSETPFEQAVELGGTAVFSIKCNYPDALFQWLFQCERIPNATNSFLALPKLRFEDAGYYTCVVYRGFDFEMSKPMQLLVFQRNENGIKVAAKVPPGLGGMWDEPIKAEKRTTQIETDSNASTLEAAVPVQPTGGGGMLAARVSMGSGLMNLAQLTFLMQPTNSTTGASTFSTIVSVTGTGCPKPYKGYVRFTAGWYPNSAASVWSVAGTGGTSTYSAITFDDTTRQRCAYGNIFNLGTYSPLRFDKPHRFVCFFSTTPSTTTTYYIQLTGFL